MGLRSTGLVFGLDLHENSLAGTLPQDGLRAMTRLIGFVVSINSLTGTLPGLSFAGMRTLVQLGISMNRLSGTLPQAVLRNAGMQQIHANDNYLQGGLPTPSEDLEVYFICSNLLAGTIPDFVSRRFRVVMFGGMVHEGSMPMTLSRMKVVHSALVLGQGLRGLLPKIVTTHWVLSVFDNGLEGHLPDLFMANYSMLLCHSNYFSCMLPAHHGRLPAFALALIGNRFAEPAEFPPWVSTDEKGKLFCVPRKGAQQLLLQGLWASCFLIASLLVAALRSRKIARIAEAFQGRGARLVRAKMAWAIAMRQYAFLTVMTIVVLTAYSDMRGFTCMAVLQMLRFPATHLQQQSQWLAQCVERISALALLQATLKFHRMQSLRKRYRTDIDGHPSALVWNLWLMVCILVSAPSALYSFVSAIPGFLSLSAEVSWILSHTVSLVTVVCAGNGLPLVAAGFSKLSKSGIQEVDLLLIGKLLTTILTPFAVTVVCHADCFGAWVLLWEPCTSATSELDSLNVDFYNNKRGSSHGKVARRGDVCALNKHVNPSRCAHAVFERLSHLLLASFLHHACTTPALCIMRKKISEKIMSVLLYYMWLLVFMLGPFLPLFIPCAFVTTVIHAYLRFNHIHHMHIVNVDRDKIVDEDTSFFPTSGLKLGMLWAMLTHMCTA